MSISARLLAICASVMALAAPALAQNVYVTADHLLDVATGQMIASPAIIIQDGVITRIGPVDSVQVPSAAEIIMLPGVTLLPASATPDGYSSTHIAQAPSPLAAIRSAAGALTPGASGDLVGVAGDPLSNTRLLDAPVFVMKRGETLIGGD